jgi:hypothetical protein
LSDFANGDSSDDSALKLRFRFDHGCQHFADRVTATLMDCIAAIAWAGERRANAFMTKVENAKKIPATTAEPSADRNVRRKIGFFILA